MNTYTTHSAKETQKIAADLASRVKHGTIALSGDLGSGKTTFVQGFAKALGIKDKIISPTFVLIRQHGKLFHIDLYRLDELQSFKELGLEEIINSPGNLVLIEWAEKAKQLLPKNTIWINFKTIDENTRQITI